MFDVLWLARNIAAIPIFECFQVLEKVASMFLNLGLYRVFEWRFVLIIARLMLAPFFQR